jgi:hypothetical protein
MSDRRIGDAAAGMPALRLLATSMALLPMVGCSGDSANGANVEISAQGAALTATDNVDRTLNGLLDAGGFLADSTSIAEALNGLSQGETQCDLVAVPCMSNTTCPAPEEVCENTDAVTEEDLTEARQEIRDGVAELVDVLRNQVLVPENLVEDTDTSATYQLTPDVLCPHQEYEQESFDQATGSYTYTTIDDGPDPQCVSDVERVQPRLRLTSPGAGDVDIAFLVTEDRIAPMVLELHQNSLGFRIDLAQALAAIEALGDEDLDAIKALDGVMQVQLVKNAALDYSLQYNVLEDLSLSVTDDDGRELHYSMGASVPTLEARFDGNARTLSLAYDYAAFQLFAPLSMLSDMFDNDDEATFSATGEIVEQEPKQYTGDVDLLVAGLSGKLTYTANSDTLAFTNLGLGNQTSTLKHNGNTLLAVDVNADHGRQFDVTAAANDDDGATIEISPTLDLSMMFDFSHVADQLDDLPKFMLGDTVRVWFEGQTPTLSVESGQVRMVSGSLHMSSSAMPEANVDVAEGMCMVSTEEQPTASDSFAAEPTTGEPGAELVAPPATEEGEAGHELLGEIEVGICE